MSNNHMRSPDALAFVRKHRGSFLSYTSDGIKAEELVSRIVFDALILGAADIRVLTADKWFLVASSIPWFLQSLGSLQIDSLFERIVPLPEAGANACRSEILLGAFASDIIVVCNRKIIYKRIQSDKSPPASVVETMNAGMAAICFAV